MKHIELNEIKLKNKKKKEKKEKIKTDKGLLKTIQVFYQCPHMKIAAASIFFPPKKCLTKMHQKSQPFTKCVCVHSSKTHCALHNKIK